MLVTPGERLCFASDATKSSEGTYELEGNVRSTVVGYKSQAEGKITVERKLATTQLPKIGDEILGKVIRVNERFATMSILVVVCSCFLFEGDTFGKR
jgi:exosome complex RNA-binding protein Csl4